MGILDDAKKLGKDAVELGVYAGEKGVDATKEVLRTKHCSECREYTQTDNGKGNCLIAGERMAVTDVTTCPQRAYVPRA